MSIRVISEIANYNSPRTDAEEEAFCAKEHFFIMAWSKKKGVQLENRADAENLWDFVDSQSPQSSTEGHS